MNIYSIYLIKNKINSKIYIGKSSNVERRIKEHLEDSDKDPKTILHKAIKKYGWENFQYEIVFQSNEKLITEKQFTNEYEPLFIKEVGSHHTNGGYNMTWGGEGWTTETLLEMSKEGKHPLQKREDGSSVASDLVKSGKHHFLKDENGFSIGKRNALKRVLNGSHNFQKKEDGSSLMSELTKIGKNPCSRKEDGSSVTLDRVKNRTHNWLKRDDGTSFGKEVAIKRVMDGTHNFIGKVACYDTNGNYCLVDKQIYEKEKTLKKDLRNYFAVGSNEGKRIKIKICN